MKLNDTHCVKATHPLLYQRITLQAPLLALHLPKSHTKATTRVPQMVTYAVREKGMEYKREQG